MKRKASYLLLFFSFVLFCACSKESDSKILPDSPDRVSPEKVDAQITQTETTEKEENDTVYHLEYSSIPLPEGGCATAQGTFGSEILLAAQTDGGAKLYQISEDGESKSLTLPDEAEYIYAIAEDNLGFWLLYGSLPAAYRNHLGDVIILDDPQGQVYLSYYSRDCSLESTIPIQNQYCGNNERFIQLLKVEDGFYFLSSGLLVYVNDAGQELARSSIADGIRFSSMQILEETLYVMVQGQMDETLDALWTMDAKTLEQTSVCDLQQTTLYGLGKLDDGKIIVNNTDAVSIFEPSSGSTEVQFSWNELGICIPGEQVQTTENGYLFYSPNETEIAMLQWLPGEQTTKKVLTLAVTTSNAILENINAAVQAFNLSQNAYQVEYTVYSDMSEGPGNDLLRTQIMAGSAPDMFCFCNTGNDVGSGIDLQSACVDLLPWMEKYHEDSFAPGLYQSLLTQNSFYQFPLTFIVDTVVAPAKFFDEPGITWEDLESARADAGSKWVTIESWNTADNLLSLTAPFCVGQYVDYNNSVCDFFNPAFMDYLSWCKTWGGDGTISDTSELALLRFKQLMNYESIAGMENYAANWFGSNGYIYVGVPNDVSSGSAYGLTTSIGISMQCRDTAGAMEFVDFCFDYFGDNSETFPASNVKLHERMELYIAGEQRNWLGETVVVSEADAAQFFDMLSRITVLKKNDSAVLQIIKEEAAAYFSNQVSDEQAAESIQSRVSLYLMEQA